MPIRNDTLALIIVVNPSSNETQSARTLTLYAQCDNCGSPNLIVQDDPQGEGGDSYSFISNADGSYSGTFSWSTQPGYTDGTVLAPLSWYETLSAFQATIIMSPSTPFTSWYFVNNGISYTTASAPSLIFNRVSCLCGNGILDPFEQCDPPNAPCCMPDCQLNPMISLGQQVTCRASVSSCDVAEMCTANGECPPDGFVTGTLCNTNPSLCGYNSYCTGSSPYCPALPTTPVPAGTLCMKAPGICYANATCDGVTTVCPPTLPTTNATCKILISTYGMVFAI